MAKKKKVNSQLPFYLTIGILVIAILGVVLFLFLDAVTLKEVESTGIGIFDDLIGEIQDKLAEHTKFNGMQIVFGYSETYAEGSILESTLNILNFSFVALIPLILVVAGIVLNIPKSKLLSLTSLNHVSKAKDESSSFISLRTFCHRISTFTLSPPTWIPKLTL